MAFIASNGLTEAGTSKTIKAGGMTVHYHDIGMGEMETGANYFARSFQWGDLTHEQAMRSIELFTAEVMASYV